MTLFRFAMSIFLLASSQASGFASCSLSSPSSLNINDDLGVSRRHVTRNGRKSTDAFTAPLPITAAAIMARPSLMMMAPHSSDSSDDSVTSPTSAASSSASSPSAAITLALFCNRLTTLIGKSASSVVSLSFFILLATKRDAITTTLFIGSILNAISGKVLKKVLNHDRPEELRSNHIQVKPSDGGMPSSHAMSLSFIGMVVLFGAIAPQHDISRIIAAGLVMILYSAIALRYRVRDHLHTTQQIIVGYLLGLVNAFVWLKFAVFSNNCGVAIGGTVTQMVQTYLISTDNEQFPVIGLIVPIVMGVLVVGSFERRIGLWLGKTKSKKE